MLLLCLIVFGSIASLSASSSISIMEADSTLPKLPCYRQLEKEVFQSGFYISAHATSIPGGVVDFIAAVARSNRKFRRCLNAHYPLGQK